VGQGGIAGGGGVGENMEGSASSVWLVCHMYALVDGWGRGGGVPAGGIAQGKACA
jgi:hypothetical protein